LSEEPIQKSGFSPGTGDRVMIIPLLGYTVEHNPERFLIVDPPR
jgi:hypothetical protein